MHAADAPHPIRGKLLVGQETVVAKHTGLKPVTRRKNKNKCTYSAVDDCTANMAPRTMLGMSVQKEMEVLAAVNNTMHSEEI